MSKSVYETLAAADVQAALNRQRAKPRRVIRRRRESHTLIEAADLLGMTLSELNKLIADGKITKTSWGMIADCELVMCEPIYGVKIPGTPAL